MTNIEPPTDDLRALFAAERDVSDVERVAIKQKLAASLGAPTAAATTIASAKLAWIAVAAIAAAAGIWWFAQSSEPASAPPVPSIEPAPMIVPEPTITATTPEPAPPEAAPSEAPAGPSQTELLAQAWRALAKDPTEALRLVELDARLHANGTLGEERDALRIQALAALGRRDEAKTRAGAFLERYPHSVHRNTIEGSVR